MAEKAWLFNYPNIPFEQVTAVSSPVNAVEGTFYIFSSEFIDLEGAFVASKVKINLLVILSTFDKCYRSDNGAAIYMSCHSQKNSEAVIRRTCFSRCAIISNTASKMGNAFYIEVYQSNSSRNEIIDSSIVYASPVLGETYQKHETMYNKNGRILIKYVNDSMNTADQHCGIACRSTSIANARYCTIAYNDAPLGCFVYCNGAPLLISNVNLIGNKMATEERGIIYANSHMTMSLCYFVDNIYAKYLFAGNAGSIEAVDIFVTEAFEVSNCEVSTTSLVQQNYPHLNIGSCQADLHNMFHSNNRLRSYCSLVLFSYQFQPH